jgi:hypothetical protein
VSVPEAQPRDVDVIGDQAESRIPGNGLDVERLLIVQMDSSGADESNPRLGQRTTKGPEGLPLRFARISCVVIAGDLVESLLVFGEVGPRAQPSSGQRGHARSFSANQRNVAGAQ